MTEKEMNNRAELFRLMAENPELPVVPMVDAEIVADDGGYWLGSWGSAKVDEYLMPRKDYEYIRYKSDDEVFETLETYLDDEDFEVLPESEEECRPAYDALPWVKAIIVYINLPD